MTHKVFVTVGTTRFDSLLDSVTSSEVLDTLEACGYTHLCIQYGTGFYKAPAHCPESIEIESFAFRLSIKDLIIDSDLVISHAGAGTVLETLTAGRPLITVINEELMGNHQTELAYQMCKDGHLLYCTPSGVAQTIKQMQCTKLTQYANGDPKKFGDFLDHVLGLSQDETR